MPNNTQWPDDILGEPLSKKKEGTNSLSQWPDDILSLPSREENPLKKEERPFQAAELDLRSGLTFLIPHVYKPGVDPFEKLEDEYNQKIRSQEPKNSKEIDDLTSLRRKYAEFKKYYYRGVPDAIAVAEGVGKGIAQNVSLLTGYDKFAGAVETHLTSEELSDWQKRGLITKFDAERYKANIEQNSFLTDVTAAITNSLLIAAEIGTTAPRTGFTLTKEGVKFFSKEGFKRYGKEIVTQGINSYRVMGPGANIRATLKTREEMLDRYNKGEEIDYLDYYGTALENVFHENFKAALEGMSEAMLGELKFASVGVKQLAKFNKEAWKGLAKNLSKKIGLGIPAETLTEQITDVYSDVFEGTKSSAYHIFAGETKEEREGALRNLLIEGITGGVLGMSIGISDAFTRKWEKEIDKMVEDGRMPVEEADKLKSEARNPKAMESFIDAMNQADVIRQSKATALGKMGEDLKFMLQLGANGEVNTVIEQTEEHKKGIDRVNFDLASNTIEANNNIMQLHKDGVKTTALDHIMQQGREDATSYLLEANDKPNTQEERTRVKETNDAISINPRTLKEYTSKVEDSASIQAINMGLPKRFESLAEDLGEEQRDEILSDIYTGIFLGYGDKGWQVVEQKHSNQENEATIKNLINEAKDVYSTSKNTTGFKDAINAINKTHDEFFAKNSLQEAEAFGFFKDEEADELTQAARHAEMQEIATTLEQPNFGLRAKGAAVRDKATGAIYTAQTEGQDFLSPFHADVYSQNQLKLDGLKGVSYEDGFLSENNEFFTKSQWKQLQDESKDLNQLDLDTSTPSSDGSTYKYNEIIGNFQGETLNDFISFLLKQQTGIIDESIADLIKILGKYIGDYKLTIESLTRNAKGQMPMGQFIPFEKDPLNSRIVINSEAFAKVGEDSIAKTMIHEALHALTYSFMRNTSYPGAKMLRAQIDGVINSLNLVLEMDEYKAVKTGLWRRKDGYAAQTDAEIDALVEELKTLKQVYADEISYYTRRSYVGKDKKTYHVLNTDEFIAGIFSDTTILREMLKRIPAIGGAEQIKMETSKLGKIKEIFNKIWKAIFGSEKVGERNLLDVISSVFWNETIQRDLENYHQLRVLAGGVLTSQDLKFLSMLTSQYKVNDESTDKSLEEEFLELDDDQIESEAETGESLKSRLEAKSFTMLLVEIADVLSVPDKNGNKLRGLAAFSQGVQDMRSIHTFREYLAKLDDASKGLVERRLKALWEKNYASSMDYDTFKRKFQAYTFRRIKSNSPRTFIRMQTNYMFDHTENVDTYKVNLIKDGNQDSAKFVYGDTVLDTFIPFLNELFGLKTEDKNTLNIHFLSAFDTFREGNPINEGRNLKSISNFDLGLKKSKTSVTDNLAQILATARPDSSIRYIYLGNFAGKNTLPILAVPVNAWNKVTSVLDTLRNYYSGVLNVDTSEGMSNAMWHSNIMRVILEELYRGAQFKVDEKTKKIQPVQSKVAGEDLNKIYKRGTAFLTQIERIAPDVQELIEFSRFKKMSGIEVSGKDFNIRTLVANIDDETVINIKTSDKEDSPVRQFKLKDLLVNTLGTARLDGASIYLLDEFDAIYDEAFGNLKTGTIKNFYSSIAGEPTLFIKHAMHGISRNSELGKFMVQHNIGILTTPDAAKITPKIKSKDEKGNEVEKNIDVNIGEHWEAGTKIPDENILNLKLSGFFFKKNEQNKDRLAGVTKQWFNGSSFIEQNPVFQAIGSGKEVVDILGRLTDRARTEAINKLQELSKPDNLLKQVIEIIKSPQGTREEQIARTFKFVLNIKPEILKFEVGNIITIPSIATALRDRVIDPLYKHLNGRIPGARLALRFNSGYLNSESDITSIDNRKARLSMLMNILPNDKVWDHALPDKFIKEKFFEYKKINREEDEAFIKGDKALGNDLRAKRKAIMDEIHAYADKSLATANSLLQSNPEQYESLKKDIETFKEWQEATGVGKFVNLNHPVVKAAIDELIWGRDIYDSKSGTSRYEPGILDRRTGTLTEDWIIVDESTARSRGWQVGDKIIAAITPTDSPLGIMSVRIGGIAKQGSTNNNVAIFNSELIQTLNGKDFDIDTIALMDYDKSYWTPDDFNKLHDIIKESRNTYKAQVTSTVKRVLEREKRTVFKEGTNKIIPINQDTVFNSREVREEYMIAMNGPHPKAESNKRRFKVVGPDFQFVDGAYLVSPSAIITERLKHTALSAINFRTKTENNEFKVNHPKWMETHIFHLFDTNFSVDFPGQTSKLVYNSDPKTPQYKESMFGHFFGDKAKVIEPLERNAIEDFMRWLLSPAFALTRQRDLEGESLDFIQMKEMIKELQINLILMGHKGEGRTKALRELSERYFDHLDSKLEKIRERYGNTHRRYTEAVEANNKIKEFLSPPEGSKRGGFILNIHVDDIYSYPLFRTILNIDVDSLPVPGTSYEDWLIDQTMATRKMIESSTFVEGIWKGQIQLDPKTKKLKYKAIQDLLTTPYRAVQREATMVLSMLNIRPNAVSWLGEKALTAGDVIPPTFVKAFNATFADNEKGFIERMNLLLDNPEILEIYKKYRIKPYELGKFEDYISNYKAVASEVGTLYGVDFVKGEGKYQITNVSILLTQLPRQLDFIFNRRGIIQGTMPSKEQLASVRNQCIALMHAQEEVEPVKLGVWDDKKNKITNVEQTPSEGLLSNRFGRQEAYPHLFKALLEKPRIKSRPISIFRGKVIEPKLSIELLGSNTKNKITVSIANNGKLGISDGNEFWYHDTLVKEAKADPTSMAAKIYKFLTEEGQAWDGIQNNSNGYKNRLELTKLLRLFDNVTYTERLDITRNVIQETLYGKNTPFTTFDREVFWLSILGQTTNKGLRDKKAQNFITDKTLWSEEKPLDFRGNEAAHELIAYFEPQLFATFVKRYHESVRTTLRYNLEIGIRVLESRPVEEVDVLLQPGFEKELTEEELAALKNPKLGSVETKTIREVATLFVDRINGLQDHINNMRAFRKLVKDLDYASAVKALEKWAHSLYLENKLLKYHLPLNGLMTDLKKLAPEEFNKKYSTLDPVEMSLDLMKLDQASEEKAILREILRTPNNKDLYEGKNKGNLLKAFRAISNVEKSLRKKEKLLAPWYKKSFLNFLTFEKMGPFSERKLYSLSPSRFRTVGFVFDKHSNGGRGYHNIEHRDLAATRALVPSHEWKGFGEVTMAIMKSREIEMTLNLLKRDMLSNIENMNMYLDLLTNPDSINNWMGKYKKGSSDKEIDWLTKILPQLKDTTIDKFALKREIFDLAESLSKPTVKGGEGIIWKTKNPQDPSTAYLFNTITGKPFESVVNGAKQIAKSPIDVIAEKYYAASAERQLKILAAMAIRRFYDVEVPSILHKAENYILRSYEQISYHGDINNLQQARALLTRYQQYITAVRAHLGRYMPHNYPIAEYKIWFHKQFMKETRLSLISQILHNQYLKQKDPNGPYDRELASIDLSAINRNGNVVGRDYDKFNKLLTKTLDSRFEREENLGNPSSYVMPNFLRRKIHDDPNYIKDGDKMHFEYVTRLIGTLKNDLKYCDWLVFESTARANGERANVIETTREWYADNIQNKMLHTQDIDIKEVKRGMQINFSIKGYTIEKLTGTPNQSEFQVWGTVDSVDLSKGEIKLYVNKEEKKFGFKTTLAKLNNMISHYNSLPYELDSFDYDFLDSKGFFADEFDLGVMRNLLQRNYITNKEFEAIQKTVKRNGKVFRTIPRIDALKLVKLGTQRQLDNVENLGVYKLVDIHTRDPLGSPIKGSVKRYRRRGSVEYLETKARELHNMKEMDGEWPNSMDSVSYHLLKGTAWTGSKIIGAYKHIMSLLYLGLVNAPKAFIQNKGGAVLSNILDAPIYNTKLWFRARREIKELSSYTPEKVKTLGSAEREWYDLLTSLGLLEKNTLTSVVLSSANLDPIDTLEGDGTLDKFRYLWKAFKNGYAFKKAIEELNQLRLTLLLEDDVTTKQKLWSEYLEKKLAFEKRVLDLSKANTGKKSKRNTSVYTRITADIGNNLTQWQALRLGGSLAFTKFEQGPLGLGLQARGERERAKAFLIGYWTAIENGHEHAEAVQFAFNSIMFRHAYYSSEYKSFGANTKLGKAMFQFAQYQNNAWLSTFKLINDGWGEIAAELENTHGNNPLSTMLKKGQVLINRTISVRDSEGNKMTSPNNSEEFLKNTNMLRVVGTRLFLTTILASVGTKAIWGLPNMLDPLGQTLYRFLALVGDSLWDTDDDDTEELRRLFTDLLFVVGIPYKTMATVGLAAEDQQAGQILTRGRIQQQLDFVFRLDNTLRSWFLHDELETEDKTLLELSYFLDGLTGLRMYGYGSFEDEGYWKTSLYLTPSWVPIQRDERYVDPINNRYIPHIPWYTTEEINEIMTGKRVDLLLDPYTYLPPIIDNFIYGE